MKDLTASLKQISNITKKNIDITDEAGNIIYSSNFRRIGSRVEDSKKVNSIQNSITIYPYGRFKFRGIRPCKINFKRCNRVGGR